MAIIVVNQFGEFVRTQLPLENSFFVQEYPEATVFRSMNGARKAAVAMRRSGKYVASYEAVTNYGMENELRERI